MQGCWHTGGVEGGATDTGADADFLCVFEGCSKLIGAAATTAQHNNSSKPLLRLCITPCVSALCYVCYQVVQQTKADAIQQYRDGLLGLVRSSSNVSSQDAASASIETSLEAQHEVGTAARGQQVVVHVLWQTLWYGVAARAHSFCLCCLSTHL